MTNEEKILSLLESHCRILEAHSQALDVQGTEIKKINLTLENEVAPQLRALAEGQKTILETVTPKSRVEQLEEEVDFLKTVIRSLSRDVAELKKAQ